MELQAEISSLCSTLVSLERTSTDNTLNINIHYMGIFNDIHFYFNNYIGMNGIQK